MGPWIVGVVFMLIGLPLIWLSLRAFARNGAPARWPQAPGVVTLSRLDESVSKQRDANGFDVDYTWYKPIVHYTYTVDGRVLEGKCIARSVDDVATTRDAARRYVDAYPAQKAISVLYDPANPTNAFLTVAPSTGAVLLLVLGGISFSIGALVFTLTVLV